MLCLNSGELSTGKRIHTIHGGKKGAEKKVKCHSAQVLAIAISSDGKFLVRLQFERSFHFNIAW